MRILQISSAKSFGETERHLVRLGRALAFRGHEVYAAVRPTSQWQDKLDFIQNVATVSVRNPFGILSAKLIGDFARSNEIDVVHAHLPRDYFPGSLACTLSKRSKFVLTRHSGAPLRPFNRFALKNLSRAIGISGAAVRALRRVFPADMITLIPDAVDTGFLTSKESARLREQFRTFHDIPIEKPLIGMMAELADHVGQRDLVLAAGEIEKRVAGVRYVIVGVDRSMDQKVRRELKRLANILSLGERFLWLNRVDDRCEFLSAIDILVAASHLENPAHLILEAMALATPVIATNVDTASEMLQDADLIVPPGEPLQLAEKIVRLLSQPTLIEETGGKLRDRAVEAHSIEKMIESIERVYKEAIEE